MNLSVPPPAVPFHVPGANLPQKAPPFSEAPPISPNTGAKNPETFMAQIDQLQNPFVTRVPSYTVANLPLPATYGVGLAFATDCTLSASAGFGTTPIGGGAFKSMCWSDAVSWFML